MKKMVMFFAVILMAANAFAQSEINIKIVEEITSSYLSVKASSDDGSIVEGQSGEFQSKLFAHNLMYSCSKSSYGTNFLVIKNDKKVSLYTVSSSVIRAKAIKDYLVFELSDRFSGQLKAKKLLIVYMDDPDISAESVIKL